MITAKQARIKEGVRYEQQKVSFNNPIEALAQLVRSELCWGAQVMEVEKTRIELNTRLMGCVDITVFEGPVDEMAPLYDLVCFYRYADESYEDLIVNHSVESIEKMQGSARAWPLFAELAGPLLVGADRLKIAVMLACGVSKDDDIKFGLKERVDDLVAALELSREGTCSFREALTV